MNESTKKVLQSNIAKLQQAIKASEDRVLFHDEAAAQHRSDIAEMRVTLNELQQSLQGGAQKMTERSWTWTCDPVVRSWGPKS